MSSRPGFSSNYVSTATLYDVRLSDYRILEQYIICDECWLRSPSFQSSSIVYITSMDNTSMHELAIQGLKERLEMKKFYPHKS